MKKSRNSTIKKERILMMISSAFVLTALTVTGIYMKGRNEQSRDDGYTIDFEALENQVQNKYAEIEQQMNREVLPGEELSAKGEGSEKEMDYVPREEPNVSVGSGVVKNKEENKEKSKSSVPTVPEEVIDPVEPVSEQPELVSPAEESLVIANQLHFSEDEKLLKPVAGEVKIPFRMDGSVYFQTLDPYKYNPAMILSAEEGADVIAGVDGKVISVFENEEIGHALTLDLGDGYQATYGQLKDISVTIGTVVNPDTVIARIAKPTKYFSLEGPNLYFMVTKDQTPIDPQGLFR